MWLILSTLKPFQASKLFPFGKIGYSTVSTPPGTITFYLLAHSVFSVQNVIPWFYCQMNCYISMKAHIIFFLFWTYFWLPAFLTRHYYLLPHLFSCHILYNLKLKSSQLNDLMLFAVMSVFLARMWGCFSSKCWNLNTSHNLWCIHIMHHECLLNYIRYCLLRLCL